MNHPPACNQPERQEEEAAILPDLADELPPLTPELLLEQVRLDLATAGLHVAPPEPLTDEGQGGVVVYLNDDSQVIVGWLSNARLDRAALDMVDADQTDDEAVIRYETVQSAMDTALGKILIGVGYTARRPDLFGFGHIVGQLTTSGPDTPERPHARA
ncbi:hypothetical protein OG402_38235 [Streptomyces anulatus]|uniref:hypothetical protein n=1 Tax=Streptomyces anulatus TaxID=1892 RepID=UPI002253240D|nr:hypothetical protein [Streptomyces anulatus]MCX4523279.1 hypothetical protein [Streptomyces anulatus]MCX4606290.1 hypothetical protein [Streptomyces anulatus]